MEVCNIDCRRCDLFQNPGQSPVRSSNNDRPKSRPIVRDSRKMQANRPCGARLQFMQSLAIQVKPIGCEIQANRNNLEDQYDNNLRLLLCLSFRWADLNFLKNLINLRSRQFSIYYIYTNCRTGSRREPLTRTSVRVGLLGNWPTCRHPALSLEGGPVRVSFLTNPRAVARVFPEIFQFL